MEPIIQVKNLTVAFELAQEKTETLKEFLIRRAKNNYYTEKFLALDHVSFEIQRGEAVGLIGKNGCGKSTLLKTIAGVYYPTSGTVKVNGNIAPLIELGAGFDPDLTARENIFLNGAIMGNSHEFMAEHFDEIIEFSELQEFVDVPVKNYSSGMYARLGFAIATIVKADILIVDEILAVGDYQFQQKCKQKMRELMDGGTTLLLVSHSIEDVQSICKKAVWIEKGRIVENGDVMSVTNDYMNSMNS